MVDPIELHYSRSKLIRLALLGLLMTALGLWVGLGGVSQGTARRGPGGWIVRLVGPEAVPILGWVLAAGSLLFVLLYLRRAFADPVAARADSSGVTINTVFGSHSYAADDIDSIALQFPAGQPILQVVPRPGQGKRRGLAVNGLVEDVEEVQAWVGQAGAALAGAPG